MSPTRRDVLTALVAMPVVALLPANVEATPVLSLTPNHLSGYGEFIDKVEHVGVGGRMEFYVDEVKAIFRVASLLTPDHWDVAIYRDPAVIAASGILSQMIREA